MIPSAAELAVHISGKDISAARTFKEVHKEATGLGKALGDVSKIAAGFVIGAGIMKLPGLVGGLTGKASDLNEVLSKNQAVFKGSAGAMEVWGDSAAKNFGQSKKQALDAAGGFGNMFSQLGLNAKAIPNMSQSVVELASDFASFHNADITEVLTAQSAAFRGEYDSLQRFLPLMNAAAVEQRAMANTGKATTKALTAQEKAMAAYQLMLSGAGEAMGDFDRTAGGLANRQRIMAAQWDDMQSKIGQALLPVMVSLAGVMLNKVIPAVSKGAEQVLPAFSAAIAQVVTFVQTHWPLISQVFQDGFVVVRDAVKNVAENVREVIDLFKLGFGGGQIGGEFTKIQTAAFQLGTFFRTVIVPAFNDAKQAIHLFFLTLQGGDAGGQLTGLQLKAMALGAAVREMWERDIQPALIALGSIVKQVVTKVIEHWETLGPIFKFAAEFIIARIEGLLQKISGIVQVVTSVVKLVDAVIHGEWAAAWKALKAIATGFVDILIGEIKFAFGNLPAVLLKAGKATLAGLLMGMQEKYRDVAIWLSGLPNNMLVQLGRVAEILLNAGREIMDGLWTGLKEKFEDVKRWVGGIADTVSNLKGPLSRDRVLLRPHGQALMEGLHEGMVKTFDEKVKPWLASAAGQVANAGGGSGSGGSGSNWTAPAPLPTPGVVAAGLVHPRLRNNPNIRRRYAQGTDYVPETGLAMLHRGEAVIPAGQNRGRGNVYVTVNVMGSIRSDNELAEVIRDKILGGGFRGVIATA